MEKVTVENLLQAIPLVSAALKLKLNENVHDVRLTNQGRHLLMKTDKAAYWVLFKREFFMSFGKIFNLEGAGESVNRDIFELAQSQNVARFIFVYPDGKVYSISPQTIVEYMQNYGTKRTTESGEFTYSFSVGLLERML